jgi:hypothetical protein
MGEARLEKISERALRLTAAVYTLLGAADYLKVHGRLPERIGGPWNYLPANYIIEQRGLEFELTEDELLVYEAIRRERRLPGGSVVLLDEEEKSSKPTKKPRGKKHA